MNTGEALAHLPLPHATTKTRRRTQATEARKALARYHRLLTPRQFDGDQPDPDRVMALLWAQARIQRALALETRGRLGDLNATPASIIADQ